MLSEDTVWVLFVNANNFYNSPDGFFLAKILQKISQKLVCSKTFPLQKMDAKETTL